MKIVKYLGRHLASACIYFTGIQLFITAVFQLLAKQTSSAMFMPMEIELLLLLFSLGMAFAEDILKISSISLTARVLIHALCYLVMTFLLFLSVTKQISNVPALLFILAGAFGVYAIVGGVILVIYLSVSRKKQARSDYESQFGK